MHLNHARHGDKDVANRDDEPLPMPRRKLHTWGSPLTDGTREKSLSDIQTGDSHEGDKPPPQRRHSVSSEPCEELDGAAPIRAWGFSLSEHTEHKACWDVDFHADFRKKLGEREGEKKFQTLYALSRPSIKVLATVFEKAKQSNVCERAQTLKLDSKEGLRESSGRDEPEARRVRAQTQGLEFGFMMSEPPASLSGSLTRILSPKARDRLRHLSPISSSQSPRFSESHGPPQFGSRMPDSGDKLFERSGLQSVSSKRLETPTIVADYYDPVPEGGNGRSEMKVPATVHAHYNLDADSDDDLPMSPSTSERRFSGCSEWLASDNPHKELEAYRRRLHEAEQELQQVAEVGQMLLNRNQELESLLQDMAANEGIQFWKRKVEYLEQEVAYQCQQLSSAQEVEVVLREKMQDLEAEIQDLRSNTIRQGRRKSYTEVVDSSHASRMAGTAAHEEEENVQQAILEVVNHNQALEEEVCRLELVVRHQKSREMELEAKIQEHERRLAMEQLEKQAEIEHQLELEDLGVFL